MKSGPPALKYIKGIDNGEANLIQQKTFEKSRSCLIGKKCLDIGCWTGGFENFLDKLPDEYFALEPDPQALKIAATRHPRGHFAAGSVFSIPFVDQSFDVVTLFLVLEHLPKNSEVKALREINRVLRPDGYLILTTPFLHSIGNVLDVAFWIKGHRHYSLKRISDIFCRGGFRVIRTEKMGGFWYGAGVNVFYFYKHVLRRPISAKLDRWIKRKQSHELERPGFADLYIVAQKHG